MMVLVMMMNATSRTENFTFDCALKMWSSLRLDEEWQQFSFLHTTWGISLLLKNSCSCGGEQNDELKKNYCKGKIPWKPLWFLWIPKLAYDDDHDNMNDSFSSPKSVLILEASLKLMTLFHKTTNCLFCIKIENLDGDEAHSLCKVCVFENVQCFESVWLFNAFSMRERAERIIFIIASQQKQICCQFKATLKMCSAGLCHSSSKWNDHEKIRHSNWSHELTVETTRIRRELTCSIVNVTKSIFTLIACKLSNLREISSLLCSVTGRKFSAPPTEWSVDVWKLISWYGNRKRDVCWTFYLA